MGTILVERPSQCRFLRLDGFGGLRSEGGLRGEGRSIIGVSCALSFSSLGHTHHRLLIPLAFALLFLCLFWLFLTHLYCQILIFQELCNWIILRPLVFYARFAGLSVLFPV